MALAEAPADQVVGRDFNICTGTEVSMRETLETINLYVRDSEATFRSLYVPTINALIEQVKADDAKRAEAAKAEEEKKA